MTYVVRFSGVPELTDDRLVFSSPITPTIVLTSTQTNFALPSVTLAAQVFPHSRGIRRIYAVVSWRKQGNSGGAFNAVNTTTMKVQVDKTGDATWVNAINIPDNSLQTAATTDEGGPVITGDIDIKSEVDADNQVYDFRFLEAEMDLNNLTLYDVQTHIVVEVF